METPKCWAFFIKLGMTMLTSIMTVYVSPIGNGFALSTILAKSILFSFSPEGTVLSKIVDFSAAAIKPSKENNSIVQTVCGRTQFGFRHTKICLPLFYTTGPEIDSNFSKQTAIKENIGFKTVSSEEIRCLQQMLQWQPSPGQNEAERVK